MKNWYFLFKLLFASKNMEHRRLMSRDINEWRQKCIQHPVKSLRWSIFAKIAHGLWPLTFLAERCNLDVMQGYAHLCASIHWYVDSSQELLQFKPNYSPSDCTFDIVLSIQFFQYRYSHFEHNYRHK